jgi:hypothetical protein
MYTNMYLFGKEQCGAKKVSRENDGKGIMMTQHRVMKLNLNGDDVSIKKDKQRSYG